MKQRPFGVMTVRNNDPYIIYALFGVMTLRRLGAMTCPVCSWVVKTFVDSLYRLSILSIRCPKLETLSCLLLFQSQKYLVFDMFTSQVHHHHPTRFSSFYYRATSIFSSTYCPPQSTPCIAGHASLSSSTDQTDSISALNGGGPLHISAHALGCLVTLGVHTTIVSMRGFRKSLSRS